MSTFYSVAFGIATLNSNNEIIEAFYPAPRLKPTPEFCAEITNHFDLKPGENRCIAIDESTANSLSKNFEAIADSDYEAECALLKSPNANLVVCILTDDTAPQSIAEVFLKLHLLSHRLVKPHQTNLTGMFGILKNLAWTNLGPIDLEDLPKAQLDARLRGEFLSIETVDKFPKMTNYVVPRGVRIAHTARVRLGAYLGEGTTIMHEGFVNFNAGTLGAAMIEGRISAGVVIGEDSDLGGGCSTMGTLSGGGTEIISVGRRCLIGANAGIGFPLADGCIVEAGLYVTAGTKINLMDSDGNVVKTSKAVDLSDRTDMLFRRNSLTGAVECVPLKKAMSLNEELHSNN